jgi:hypothetical protein
MHQKALAWNKTARFERRCLVFEIEAFSLSARDGDGAALVLRGTPQSAARTELRKALSMRLDEHYDENARGS